MLAVGLLGPLEVSVEGRPVALTTGRLRTLLAVLAMSAGTAVSVDRLADAVWGTDSPGNARRSLQTYVTRLRRAIGPELISTQPSGYVLYVDPDQVDALRFVRLLEAASAASDTAAERAGLAEALGLWRGMPFEGLGSGWLEEAEVPGLLERYLTALERRVDLDIADGRHGELVAELGALAARHPLRESLWVRLLVVLDRCGRQAEALARYEAIRVRIADELGVDPSPELQRIYADLLTRRQPEPPEAAGPAAGPQVEAQQLSADLASFTGRVAELDQLVALTHGEPGSAVVISTIDGMAGIGKTALAIHAAHRLADRFPDGQLFVDLHGYTEGEQPVDAAEALDRVLRSLGVPGEQIPPDTEDRAALYRGRLADRKILILLDNAATDAQVQPLLPGTPGCLVLVTSRRRLTGLVEPPRRSPPPPV